MSPVPMRTTGDGDGEDEGEGDGAAAGVPDAEGEAVAPDGVGTDGVAGDGLTTATDVGAVETSIVDGGADGRNAPSSHAIDERRREPGEHDSGHDAALDPGGCGSRFHCPEA